MYHFNRCIKIIGQNPTSIYDFKKNSQQIRGNEDILNLIKGIYKTLIANLHDGEKLKYFHPKIKNKAKMSDFITNINIILEVLKANAIKKQKKVKGIQIIKEKVKLSSFSNFFWLFYVFCSSM